LKAHVAPLVDEGRKVERDGACMVFDEKRFAKHFTETRGVVLPVSLFRETANNIMGKI
jgi:hypothetical protein